MRYGEALRINAQPALEGSRKRDIHLVCGFTPLHFETYLQAHLNLHFPGDEICVHTGLFNDLEGNLRRACETGSDGIVLAIEWSDLDARLGLRASAGWAARTLDDILAQVEEKTKRLEALLAAPGRATPVALIAPALALPPLVNLPPGQCSPFELQLRATLATFVSRVCGLSGVRIVSDHALAASSPPPARANPKLDLSAGFPYTLPHADAAAALCVPCLFPAESAKGIITDLDDTLWKGILGDAGSEGVTWSLEGKSQAHALYQQLLASLAGSGVLVAVASKNDPALVREAFARPDILLQPSQVFPVEAGWGAKSASVARILKAWNIGADAVVFVDDSPMELAEVKEKHPQVECLRFTPDDPAAILELLYRLRSRFGKSEVREEDRLRLASLRASAALEEAHSSEAPADFLAGLDARLTLEFANVAGDGRALELVNKTNQFNLNGRRFTELEWESYFRQPGAFAITVSYEDRFGPLGRIAVLAGRLAAERMPEESGPAVQCQVDVWVMSCRAFSRHIEFQVLKRLYEKLGAGNIEFAFETTPRNGPIEAFFGRMVTAGRPRQGLELPAADFERTCPPLFHQVIEKWTTSEKNLRSAFP